MDNVWVLRHRNRGSLTGKAKYHYRILPENCNTNRGFGPWSAWAESSPIIGETETMDDYQTPGYWKKLQKGEWIQPNDLWKVKSTNQLIGWSNYFSSYIAAPTCSNPSLYNSIEYEGNVLAVVTNGLGAIAILDPLDVQNLIRELETRCMANRQSGEANYFESLAEMDQAHRMLVSPLENGHRFVSEFKRAKSYRRLQKDWEKFPNLARYTGRLSQLVAAEKAFLMLLSSEWLRFRYGIKPIMSDAAAAMKTLSETYDIKPKRHKTQVSGILSKVGHDRVTVVSGVYEFYHQKIYSDDISIRVYWFDEYRRTPYDKLGLSLQNALVLPWELTHLSFVVDWFINIGDLLYANMPRVGVVPLGGARFSRQFTQTTWIGDGFKDLSPTTNHLTGSFADGVVCTAERKFRTKIDGSTSLVIKSDFRLDNWVRATDALTLLVNQLSTLRLR
jgi:hypothetical protein